MVEFSDERKLVIEAESQLEHWTTRARAEAYAELFEGEDSILTAEEIRLLDAIDSTMKRQGVNGVWGTDQYGIHTAGSRSSEPSLGVVCVYHSRITRDSVLRGVDDVDDETEDRLNAALWQYCERVASLIEADLHEFVRHTES